MSNGNNATITGQVIHVGETEQISDTFRKRLCVVNDGDDKYPQELPIEFTQDAVAKLDAIQVGQMVTIEVNLRGHAWKDRWFPSFQGWRIESQQQPADGQPAKENAGAPMAESDDNLPF